MAGGCIDLLLGRRGDFEKCKYWVRDEEDEDLSQYVYEVSPTGSFYGTEVSPEDLRKMIVNNVFMFDESLVTIYTNGYIDLKKGDLVEFRDEIWIVQSCQSKRVRKSIQFMKNPPKRTYIQLKR